MGTPYILKYRPLLLPIMKQNALANKSFTCFLLKNLYTQQNISLYFPLNAYIQGTLLKIFKCVRENRMGSVYTYERPFRKEKTHDARQRAN